jgi:hypothetical protein
MSAEQIATFSARLLREGFAFYQVMGMGYPVTVSHVDIVSVAKVTQIGQ